MYLIWFYSKKSLFKLNKFDYYKKSFKELWEAWIKIIYFYKEDLWYILDHSITEWINKIGVNLISFENESEIISYLKKLKGKIFINTFEEQEIEFTNLIRKNIGQKTTENSNIFLNKYLQRSIIWEQFPETIVQYKEIIIKDSEYVEEKDFPPMPCILKPTWGVQSSWVCKIENYSDYKKSLKIIKESLEKLENKRLKNESILIEEFIDGNMYTIDYYIDEDQTIAISKPVFIKLWVDYWINDFCNISRFTSKEIEYNIDQQKLYEFIKKTVIWWKIRNTFVHHEFKINSKWEFKTIETNWRIGWFRLDMYHIWYNMNLLSFPFKDHKKDFTLENNIAMFALYPKETAIFKWYNEKIIKEIESLKSFHRINRWIKLIWTEIGLTQNGYGKVWSIELANSNYQEFRKDVEYIEKIYFDILKTK